MKKRESLREIEDELNELLKIANKGVRPPDYMIKFYNFMGKIPFKIGVFVFLLTAIDTGKVTIRAIQNRTDAAIQVIYKYKFRPWRLLWGIGDHLWLNSYNCRSVRSRGIFTREAIRILIQAVGEKKPRINVASIGSGSGSQMLQGIADNNLRIEDLHLSLVDNDFRALEMGRKNARILGIEDMIEAHEKTAGMYFKTTQKESLNLIEMVGLTDYFDEKRFFSYLEEVCKILAPGGFFLGANISSREEAYYAHKVAHWPEMYYRDREEIINTLRTAGFGKIWTGECGLYTFWIGQKE